MPADIVSTLYKRWFKSEFEPLIEHCEEATSPIKTYWHTEVPKLAFDKVSFILRANGFVITDIAELEASYRIITKIPLRWRKK